MKRFISIFGLLFLASCQEETIYNHSPCSLVVLSDALPVQFWLADCDTYNETVPKGVHEKCFCAPWNCNDQIRIQFTEDFSPDADYYLLAKDENNQYLADLLFTEIEAGVHSVAFSPETEGICDDVISLEIVDVADILRMLAPSSWTNPGGYDTFDTKSGTQLIEALTSADGIIAANMAFVVPAGTKVTFTYTVTVTGTWTATAPGIFISFSLRDASDVSVSTGSLASADKYITANGTYSFTETLTTTAESAVLQAVLFETTITSGTANVTITVPVDQVLYADPLAKSDCLDIKLAHDETELFDYSNGRNFAGLIHQDISPDATFNIRIPCRFFHEVFPEEDEAMELTSQVVTTSSQLKSQKLLEVQMVPYYFHKKLQLILKHQTLTNNDIAYKKEEKYEIIEGNKRWPLKQATCLLTEKSSVLRNVL